MRPLNKILLILTQLKKKKKKIHWLSLSGISRFFFLFCINFGHNLIINFWISYFINYSLKCKKVEKVEMRIKKTFSYKCFVLLYLFFNVVLLVFICFFSPRTVHFPLLVANDTASIPLWLLSSVCFQISEAKIQNYPQLK